MERSKSRMRRFEIVQFWLAPPGAREGSNTRKGLEVDRWQISRPLDGGTPERVGRQSDVVDAARGEDLEVIGG